MNGSEEYEEWQRPNSSRSLGPIRHHAETTSRMPEKDSPDSDFLQRNAELPTLIVKRTTSPVRLTQVVKVNYVLIALLVSRTH